MFKLMGKKIITMLRSKSFLIWTYELNIKCELLLFLSNKIDLKRTDRNLHAMSPKLMVHDKNMITKAMFCFLVASLMQAYSDPKD